MTTDQFYASVMSAMAATEAYKGSVTVEGIMKQTGESVMNANMKMSVDATNKVFYNTQLSEYSVGEEMRSYKSVDKMFVEGGNYYTYEAYDEEVEYVRLTAAQAEAEIEDWSMEGISEVVEGLPLELTSVDAFNAAFAEVFADSKAAMEDSGTEADGSCVVSCTEVEGVLTVNMAMWIEMTIPEMGAVEVESIIAIVAEGGYITEMVIKQIMNMTAGEETMENSNEMTYKIAYAFDQAGYDAIVTTLPADVQDKEADNYGYDKDLDTIINGVPGYTAWMSGENMQSAITNFLTEEYKFNGMDVTWYTDEACTKAFTADITAEEMDALTTLYGKATLKEGYAFVITSYTYAYAEDVTDAYKVVFETLGMVNVGVNKSIEAVCESFSVEEGATVNGVEVEFAEEDYGYKSMTATAGETYVVEYQQTYTKDALNIFAMLMEDMM